MITRSPISTIRAKSMRDTFVVSLNSIFSELTEKQSSSLVTALEAGYYQIPKKVTTQQIAVKRKVTRTTCEEHLRKAESNVLQAIAAYVRLYSSSVSRAFEPAPKIAE